VSAAFTTSRRVEFRDTDAAGIAHFTTFFAFMEEAEHEFLRSRGLSVMHQDAQGKLTWPRVSARCDFSGAVKFEDELQVQVAPARVGEKSVTYEFVFSHEGREVARGEMTSVCCRFDAAGRPQSVPIPPWFSQKLT
jgi:4-hydroxybenzoyl-CoA thioesterase/acyl-CoA thioester hydrolase